MGPPPIPIDKLTTEGLTEALEYMRRPEALEAAKAAAADIRAVRSAAGIVGVGTGRSRRSVYYGRCARGLGAEQAAQREVAVWCIFMLGWVRDSVRV